MNSIEIMEMGINKGTLHNYIKEDGLLFRAYSAALDNYNNEIATSINAVGREHCNLGHEL